MIALSFFILPASNPTMLALAAFGAGFVAPSVPCDPALVLRSRACKAPTMGLFDGLKGAFDNDPRLEKDRQVNAGVNKNAPGYVKQKQTEREKQGTWQQQNKANQKSARDEAGQGDRKIEDLFKDWKW